MAKSATKATAPAPEQPSTDVAPRDAIVGEVIRGSEFDMDTLRTLGSFEDALSLAADTHGGVVDASKEIGDGFALLDEEGKARLVGVPLIFMEWTFYSGDYGSNFVSSRVVVRNPDGGMSKYIINDGSTGIADQLARVQNSTGRTGGLFCRYGLRVSEYTYCTSCSSVVRPDVDSAHAANHKKAATYYLDTRA